MVLEISATPFIFTFKLWDWGRVGIDGIPRPIHVDHGAKNIQWDRDTEWVESNLLGQVEVVSEREGVREERTGLHDLEFIEVRRHWFTDDAHHDTEGTVNVLNLVEGDEVEIASPTGAFAPYRIHYAETFIVPAAVGPYIIRRTAESQSERFATVKAYVRGTRDHATTEKTHSSTAAPPCRYECIPANFAFGVGNDTNVSGKQRTMAEAKIRGAPPLCREHQHSAHEQGSSL